MGLKLTSQGEQQTLAFQTAAGKLDASNRVSSMKIVDMNPNLCKWALAGFRSFVNNLGEEARPFGKAVYL